MGIESAVKVSRVGRLASLAVAAGMLPGSAVVAQLPIKPPAPVMSGSVIPFHHGASGLWNQIYSLKIAPNGNLLFLDSAASAIYQLAPGSASPTLVVGATKSSSGSDCSALEGNGTYWNAAVAFDKWNNLYVTDRYGSAVKFCRVPYNPSSGTWNFSNTDIWSGPTFTQNGAETQISPQDIASGDDGTTFYVSTSGGTGPPSIYKFTVDEQGNVTSTTPMITSLEEYSSSVAVDHAGNLFFVENIYGSTPGTRVNGIREIPATATLPITGDGSGSAESNQTLLVGSSNAYQAITGVSFDAQGNLYFGSTSNSNYGGYVAGVFMVPNEGTPTAPNLVWNDTVMVSPVNAGHGPLVDPRGYMWIPTGGSGNWAPPGSVAPSCDSTTTQTVDATCLTSSMVLWQPGSGEAGVSVTGAPVSITAFSVSTAGGTLTLTADNSFQQGQVVTISAGADDALAALNGLSFYVLGGASLTSAQFQISTGLIPAGSSGSTTATVSGAAIQTVYYTFNQQTTVPKLAFAQAAGNNFSLVGNPTPDTSTNPPVPPCTAGATYPAFSPNETTVDEYSWCAAYVQLNAQKAGSASNELQMLDASNNVIAGSNAFVHGIGQGAAVSMVRSPVIVSIASGLNHPMQVASDLSGNTYVADSALKAIEKYPAGTTSPTSGTVVGTGLTAPSGVAVDGAGNLYIGDSGSVYEIPFVNGALATSKQTKIAGGLGSGNLNLAVDGGGNVFVADQANKRVVEIPNAQAALLRQNLPVKSLAPNAGFAGPSAIATDNAGNVWVADGSNLWEIAMPFGVATEVTSKLQAPVTGLAVDPSGSVFVAEGSGLVWIPYQVTSTSSGLNINGAVQVATGLGTNNAQLPYSVALDGTQNLYVSYGSGTTAGLAQVGIDGAVNFDEFGEVNPNVPLEADAELFNLGNAPLTLADFAGDAITGDSAADYSLGAATLNTPACGPDTSAQPGTSCYLGLNILAPSPGMATASVAVLSNATNAAALNVAMTADVIEDFRPATSLTVQVTPTTSGDNCGGSTYPGCVTITVTVTSDAGTPDGTVKLSVPGSGAAQAQQTQTLTDGAATFTLTALLGGSYNVNALYGGSGTAGATQDTCSPAGSSCFAGSAGKTTFTVTPATPKFQVGPPGNFGCLAAGTTPTDPCTADPSIVTVWAGNTYIQAGKGAYITASVTSEVGTPTGSVSFLVNGKPADPAQAQNPLNSSGVASFSTANLNQGVYTITAVYNGDQNYASQSIALPEFEVISASVQITADPATVSTKAGTPVQATLNLQPLVGFAGDVSLQCMAATLPQYSQCTFAYPNSSGGTAPVGRSGATTGTSVVVTISSNVPVNGGATTGSIAPQETWTLAGLFGLGLLGLAAGRKRLNRYLALVCLALLFSGAFLGISACTNNGYSTPPPAPKVATPGGTYNVQIISYDPKTLQQNSLTTPVFTLPVTVQ